MGNSAASKAAPGAAPSLGGAARTAPEVASSDARPFHRPIMETAGGTIHRARQGAEFQFHPKLEPVSQVGSAAAAAPAAAPDSSPAEAASFVDPEVVAARNAVAASRCLVRAGSGNAEGAQKVYYAVRLPPASASASSSE